MTSTTPARRMTAAATAISVALGASPAVAVPPPIGVQNEVSPPSRVGRLAHITGAVSFHTADETAWSPATLNYPITTGNALWTEPSADALVEVSGNRLALDGATELDVATLDDQALVASEPQGELYLHLRQVPNGDTYTVQTPRGAVQIASVGRYEVAAGDSDHPTTVTVVEGAAQITGSKVALQVGAGQTASIDGTTTFQGAVGPMRQDAFLTKMLAQERPAPRSAVAAPPVVAQMTGSSDLDQYGSWSETPQNGSVWYPQVESGWTPYRHGRWSYVAPWGWTWVDESPWGFAPFHYGRWVQNDNRWGWVPADPAVQAYPAPVYAPALVSWVDVGAALAVGAAAGALLSRGGGDRSVGWVPLGPSEPYYPPYSHSLNYVRSVNGSNIRNVNTVINTTTINNRTVVQNFVNRGGATIVPAAVMAQSAPIAAAARPIAPQQFAQARTQVQAPIAPTAATAGVTPAVARQFNFTPATRPATAGPAINPAAFRPVGPRGAAPAFVPFPRPSNAAAGAPTTPGTPQAGTPRQDNPAAIGAAPRVAVPGEPRPEPAIRPGTSAPAVDAARPAVPVPEAARPGVLPTLRPATPPGAEPARPPALASPAVTPPRVTEPARRAPAPPGVATPGPAARFAEPGRPAPAVEPARPSPAAAPAPPAPAARPTPTATEPARPPEPRPAPAVQPPRPVQATAPARPPEPRPEPAVQAPHPVQEAAPARPPEPRPAPAVQPPRPVQATAPARPPEPRPEPAMQAPHPVQAAAPARPPEPRPAPAVQAPRPPPAAHPAAAPHPPPNEEHH